MVNKEDDDLGLPERFWVKVRKGPGPNDCWEWIAGRYTSGYGTFWLDGGMKQAHRVALAGKLGRPIKPKLHALHKCDNPPCVNPAHLWEGTREENIQDCVQKGRHVTGHGESSHLAKLSDNDIREIREWKGIQRVIGEKFGISQAHVSRIQLGQSWAHLD